MTPDPQEWTAGGAGPSGQDLQEALATAAHRVRPRADAWADNQARLHRRRAHRRSVAVAVAGVVAGAAAALVVAGVVVFPTARDAQRIEPAASPPTSERGLPTWRPIVYPELIAPIAQFHEDGGDLVSWLVVGRPNLANSFFAPRNPNEPRPFPELAADDLVTCVGEGPARSHGDVGLMCIPGGDPVPGLPYLSGHGSPVPGRPEMTRWVLLVRPDVRSLEVLFGAMNDGRGEVAGVLPATRLAPGSRARVRAFTLDAPTGAQLLGYRAVLDDGRRDRHDSVELVNPPAG